jgi:hypothetical protein
MALVLTEQAAIARQLHVLDGTYNYKTTVMMRRFVKKMCRSVLKTVFSVSASRRNTLVAGAEVPSVSSNTLVTAVCTERRLLVQGLVLFVCSH